MTKKNQHNQAGQEESAKIKIPDISVAPAPEPGTASGREIELSNNPKKVSRIHKKAKDTSVAKADSLNVSNLNASDQSSRLANPIHLPTNNKPEDNNSKGKSNNLSSTRNTLSIASLAFSICLVIFVLLFCVVPIKQVSYQVPVVYQDVETYTEQEPYVATINYTEQEPYTVTESYTATEPYTVSEPYLMYMPRPTPPPGPPPGPPPTPPPTPPPGPPPGPPPPRPDPHILQYRNVIYYTQVLKYRDVVKYKDVEKTRTEVRYRPVQKQRTVTKVREETRYKMVPMLYSLITYETNAS